MPTCSAPVRRVSEANPTPLDLHALGTPPALILSQDQTLHQYRLQRACLLAEACLTEVRPDPAGSVVCVDGRTNHVRVLASEVHSSLPAQFPDPGDSGAPSLAPSSAHDGSVSSSSLLTSVRCASLSTCCSPFAGTASARPMRLLPLHPPHLAARSTLGGRSSPEPAKPTVASSPCQGLRHGAIALCIPSEVTR